MNKVVYRLLGAGLLGLGGLAQGALINAGNGLINDTTQNLVWTQDANLAATETFGVSGINADGTMTWGKAREWIRAMNLANYKGYNDWRLYQVTDTGPPGCDQAFSGTDCGWNIDLSTSELGHLWYGSLGNIAFMDTSGNYPQPGWQGQNFNKGPFTNLEGVFYWSGTEYAVSPFDRAWAFFALDGDQSAALKDRPSYGWAVRSGQVPGVDPIPITAEQAFDAVMSGCLPDTPEAPGACYGVGKVKIVDVRTYEEYHLQGTPGKVDEIVLKAEENCDKDGHNKGHHHHHGHDKCQETTIVPDLGKTKLVKDSKILEYTLAGKKKQTPLDRISKVVTSPISVNIQCAKWNQETKAFDADSEGFSAGMDDLADSGVMVPITMCNSGGRSTQCPYGFLDDDVADKFAAIYEIDRAGDQYTVTAEGAAATGLPEGAHVAGLGGFNGSDYGGDYNANVGYPGRPTDKVAELGWTDLAIGGPTGPSVGWKDSGLPVYISDTACYLGE